MNRWKQQGATVCIFGTVNCAFGENASDARRIVTEHNTDCDAYEEKIAELQRRLDAVVALIESKVPSEKRPTETQYQYINRQRYNNAQIQMGARIRAIAEGREG